MYSLLIVFFLFFFSCSTTNEIKNITGEGTVTEKKQELYYMPAPDSEKEYIMLKKGFRIKKENEEFGSGLYGYIDNKKTLLVTSDMEVFKWAIRMEAFVATILSLNVNGIRSTPLLLKVRVAGKDIACLTSEPFKITGTDNEFFSHGECADDVCKIKDIPSMDDVFVIDKTAYDKYCTPYNPDNRFMKISRDVLMEKYFTKYVTTGVYKFACVDEIHPQFSRNSSEEFKCEQILIDHKNNLDERPDFIYALIVKGIYFFMSEADMTTLDLDHAIFKE